MKPVVKKVVKRMIANGNLEAGKSNTNMSPYVTNKKKLLLCFFGIFISYFYYGIIQEKM